MTAQGPDHPPCPLAASTAYLRPEGGPEANPVPVPSPNGEGTCGSKNGIEKGSGASAGASHRGLRKPSDCLMTHAGLSWRRDQTTARMRRVRCTRAICSVPDPVRLSRRYPMEGEVVRMPKGTGEVLARPEKPGQRPNPPGEVLVRSAARLRRVDTRWAKGYVVPTGLDSALGRARPTDMPSLRDGWRACTGPGHAALPVGHNPRWFGHSAPNRLRGYIPAICVLRHGSVCWPAR